MKTSILQTIALAIALPAALAAQATPRLTIIGDASALGSADTTIVDRSAPAGALTWQSGLRRDPATATTSTTAYSAALGADMRGQTIVNGLHSRLGGTRIYEIISADGPIAALDTDAITSMVLSPDKPEAVVWMQGDADVAAFTDKAAYKARLKEIQARLGVKMALVQPSTAALRFANRPAEMDNAAPTMAIATAMLELATERPADFALAAPTYQLDYCADGSTPRAADMSTIGILAGRAISSTAPAAIYPTAITATDNTLTVSFTTADGSSLAIDTLSVAAAPNLGFDLWRGQGADTRRLNITAVNVGPDAVTITTNETLNDGDRLIYGNGGSSTGRLEGSRGNLRTSAYTGAATATPRDWCPLFEMTVADVAHPAANISGRVTCQGEPVAGVAVSDGYVVTTTDPDGYYHLASAKRLGYVFYTLPAGYEPETESNGWQVKIYSLLTDTDTSVAETHDFKLTRADNDRHIFLAAADTHLAKRNTDLSQFKKGFVARVKEFAAANPGAKIYSTILGDLAWDQFWTQNGYGLPEFVNTMTDDGYPLMLFPVIGNHDNDPSVPAGADTDFLSAVPYRQNISPSFYSFNLGKAHYAVLDDIVYVNTCNPSTSYNDGVAGDRDYNRYITDEQLEWLRKDLALVTDKSTPVFILVHIPNWKLTSSAGTYTATANLTNSSADAVARAVAAFDNVHILSGHTHYNYTANPAAYPNIKEHNIAAVCATWWWTGKLTGRHICVDGTPGGFATFDIDGRDIAWKYRSIESNGDLQARVYDMNAVKAAFASDDDIKAYIASHTSHTDYADYADNMVLVNVFNYDDDWTVEILEDGQPLTVSRVTTEDPLHTICYDVPRYKAAGTVTSGFTSSKTTHMFRAQAATADKTVTVRVTDSFGNVYTTGLTRPCTFDSTMP
jgi:hypothetical protein